MTLNPKTGGIQSIFDKQIGRELVDADSEYNLGELIYVTGGDGSSAIHSDLENLPPPKFETHRQTGTKIGKIAGPVFGELTNESTAENFPKITLRVRLYRGLKQLDLIFQLDKTETTKKEAVYLAFPFAADASKGGLWLEYPDQITEPLHDQHSSACRDWYSVQHWLAVSDGDSTVEISPLDAPLFTIGEMTASTWPRKLSLKRGHVFAYIMNNYWHTNYKASQGGRVHLPLFADFQRRRIFQTRCGRQRLEHVLPAGCGARGRRSHAAAFIHRTIAARRRAGGNAAYHDQAGRGWKRLRLPAVRFRRRRRHGNIDFAGTGPRGA